MSRKQLDDTGKSQHDHFLETARALGCDEDPMAFDEKLAVVARATKAGISHSHAGKTAANKDQDRE